jgi:uncharacterized integral membrane protein (TIGR00698 family)
MVFAAHHVAQWLGEALLRARGLPSGKSPVPAITVAVIAGLLLSRVLGSRAALKPGLAFCVKKLLRWGIVLIGIRLSFGAVMEQGARAAVIVVVLVAFAVVVARWMAKMLGLSERLGLLAAASTGICGVTATLAVAPVVEADEREVAYTVANVTLCGLVGMLFYPPLAHWMYGGDPTPAGLFLGTAIHDTSQVTGAALAYAQAYGESVVKDVAIVTKLTRNTLLVAMVPLLAMLHARRTGSATRTPGWRGLFPVFVLGFLAMALLRTAGDAGLGAQGTGRALGVFDAATWASVTDGIERTGSLWLLPAAMAALGLTTDFRALRGMGFRPLWLGALTALCVGALAAVLAGVAA